MNRHACTDPKHHVHDASAFVAAVERASHERGLRLTPIRARVLGLIAEAGKPLKAYDLLDQVRRPGEGAGAAAPPTVYRALDFLLAERLHPQARIRQRLRRLPPPQHRATLGAVPHLRPLPFGG